jgi:hypothetical protein
VATLGAAQIFFLLTTALQHVEMSLTTLAAIFVNRHEEIVFSYSFCPLFSVFSFLSLGSPGTLRAVGSQADDIQVGTPNFGRMTNCNKK